MAELLSCLMPTYNRYSFQHTQRLVEEAVHSFLIQDDQDKELIICNDTPGQFLVCNYPGVRVFNSPKRFPNLSRKIQYMIEVSSGTILCRWDDDDICLAHRLRYSRAKLGNSLEWRSENYWFDHNGVLKYNQGAGNQHITGIWRRKLLLAFPLGTYPVDRSGDEDQQFNTLVESRLGHARGELVPRAEMFYLYRWGTGGPHLSGVLDPSGHGHQSNYDEIGQRPINEGTFHVEPKWHIDHQERVRQALENAEA